MATRLVEIYRQEKAKSGGLVSTFAKRGMEKFDPRKKLNQEGMLVEMLPFLKAYSATGKGSGKTAGRSATKTPSVDIGAATVLQSEELKIIKINTRISATNSTITAKNSMMLPLMARELNVMRQNIGKLVKLRGETPTNKADAYFLKSKEREAAYESQFAKTDSKVIKSSGDKKEGGILSTLMGLLGLGGIGMMLKTSLSGLIGGIGTMLKTMLKIALSGLIGGIGAIAKGLKRFGGILGAAFVGWEIGSWLGEKFNEWYKDWSLSKGGTGSLGSDIFDVVQNFKNMLSNLWNDVKNWIKEKITGNRNPLKLGNERVPPPTPVTYAQQQILTGEAGKKFFANKTDENQLEYHKQLMKLGEFGRGDSELDIGVSPSLIKSQKQSSTSGQIGLGTQGVSGRITGPTPTKTDGVSLLNKVLDDEGVQDPAVRQRIFALAQAESSLNPNAKGPVIEKGMHKGDQARGLLQIMPKTAPEVGYTKEEIENDPEKAAKAGVKYFLKNYKKFNSLDLATIAHHAGPGGAQEYKETGSINTKDRTTNLKTTDYLSKVQKLDTSMKIPGAQIAAVSRANAAATSSRQEQLVINAPNNSTTTVASSGGGGGVPTPTVTPDRDALWTATFSG